MGNSGSAKGFPVFGTHIAIYLMNAGNTRTPLHENSPNQVTNSETSPGPPPATAVHPSRGPCPGRKSTVNFPTSLTLPDCRYPLPTAIPKHPEPPPLKTAACHGGLPFCPFPGRSLIFCHVYCPPDENWTEFLTFQIRTESAEAAESGGAGQEGKQPGLSTDTGSVSVRRQRWFPERLPGVPETNDFRHGLFHHL